MAIPDSAVFHADFRPLLGAFMTEQTNDWLHLNYGLGHIFFLILAKAWWHAANSVCGQPRHEADIPFLGS
jgi:hypothetical protein